MTYGYLDMALIVQDGCCVKALRLQGDPLMLIWWRNPVTEDFEIKQLLCIWIWIFSKKCSWLQCFCGTQWFSRIPLINCRTNWIKSWNKSSEPCTVSMARVNIHGDCCTRSTWKSPENYVNFFYLIYVHFKKCEYSLLDRIWFSCKIYKNATIRNSLNVSFSKCFFYLSHFLSENWHLFLFHFLFHS